MNRKKLKKKSQKVAKPIDLYFLIISTVIVIPLFYSTKTLDPNLAPRLIALGVIMFVLSVINIIKPVKDCPQFDFIKLLICSFFGLSESLFSLFSFYIFFARFFHLPKLLTRQKDYSTLLKLSYQLVY